MEITGQDLFKIWMAWPETEDCFVIKYETWWGDPRHLNVVKMSPCLHDNSCYEIHCYTGTFRSVSHIIKKTQEFEITEPGRFEAKDW